MNMLLTPGPTNRKDYMTMNMIPIASTNISSIGYEGTTLHIRFNSGGLYAYHGDPSNVYNSLMNAPSKGKYFHANIKGRYGDTRIG